MQKREKLILKESVWGARKSDWGGLRASLWGGLLNDRMCCWGVYAHDSCKIPKKRIQGLGNPTQLWNGFPDFHDKSRWSGNTLSREEYESLPPSLQLGSDYQQIAYVWLAIRINDHPKLSKKVKARYLQKYVFGPNGVDVEYRENE